MFNHPKMVRCFCAVFTLFMVCAISTAAQTTAFSYQGRLTDGASAASGTYGMQFALFDAVSAGSQIGLRPFVAFVCGFVQNHVSLQIAVNICEQAR